MPRPPKPLGRGGLTVMLRDEIEKAEQTIETIGWDLPPKGAPRLTFVASCCAAAQGSRPKDFDSVTVRDRGELVTVATPRVTPVVPARFAQFANAYCAMTFAMVEALETKSFRHFAAATGRLGRGRTHSQTKAEERLNARARVLAKREADSLL